MNLAKILGKQNLKDLPNSDFEKLKTRVELEQLRRIEKQNYTLTLESNDGELLSITLGEQNRREIDKLRLLFRDNIHVTFKEHK